MTTWGDDMDPVKIGAFIAALRKEQSLTQKQLAQRLAVSDKTVSKWETGRGLPDISIMLSLCETLHISINELLSGEKLDEASYREKADANIIALMQRKSRKEAVLHVAISAVLFFAAVFMFPLAAEQIISPIGILLTLFWSILLIVGNAVAGITYGILKQWKKPRLLFIFAYNVLLLLVLIRMFSIASIVCSVS